MNYPKTQLATEHSTPISSTWNAIQADASHFVILAKGTGTIPTTADTFQVGCIAIVSDVGAAAPALFFNAGTTAAPVWQALSSAGVVSPAYLKDNSNGGNNAICVSFFSNGVKVPITTGTRVAIELTHTLQKGANTVNVNGTSKSLKNSTNLLDITTAYVVGGVIEVMYLNGVAGGIWVDLKQ